jgi:hypothetical protein
VISLIVIASAFLVSKYAPRMPAPLIGVLLTVLAVAVNAAIAVAIWCSFYGARWVWNNTGKAARRSRAPQRHTRGGEGQLANCRVFHLSQ